MVQDEDGVVAHMAFIQPYLVKRKQKERSKPKKKPFSGYSNIRNITEMYKFNSCLMRQNIKSSPKR